LKGAFAPLFLKIKGGLKNEYCWYYGKDGKKDGVRF
jgi:hypothetical protein